MEPMVGIDLGTTNSEVAVIIDGRAEVIQDSDSGIFPSCVGLDAEGKLIVGREARNQAVIAPERTVLSVKRLMGTDQELRLGDQAFRPPEISAFILKALKERAEKALARPVTKAVITVPAYFTDAQRQATREAGEIAGLEVVRIINEPTAAALAYESGHAGAQKILVYDLGGGTFDVSIVKIEAGVVEVLSSTGDNHLGGDDFDEKIVALMAAHIEEKFEVDVKEDRQVLARLRRAAEAAKVTLSDAPFAPIEEDHIARKGSRDLHLSYELSRDDFEDLIEDDLLRTMEAVTRALEDASLLPGEVDKIILVGGSTRIPRISDLLEEKIGLLPHGEIDPDLCVALGASIQAGREMGLDTASILIDITPYTFGTSALGTVDGLPSADMFVPMIRRNTKLPAKKSDLFYTVHDNQKAVKINVYQGENPDARENVRIGDYIFNLTPAPANSEIVLDFELDVNGILKLEAREKHTGRTINAVIENAVSRAGGEDVAQSRRTVERMWGEPAAPEAEPPAETSAAAGLLQRAEAALATAPPEDRDEIVNLMEDIRDALAAGREADVLELTQALEDILFYLE